MDKNELLWKLEGLHTVDTIAEALSIKKQSALNLLSKLRKEGHVTLFAGGKKKRIFRISMRKQRKRDPGMWDILNKYNPNFKLNPWYDHQVYGLYGPEEALIDALQTNSFRTILATLRLFNHIKDWKKLYKMAKEKNCWQKIGALYDVASRYFRVKKMPKRYNHYEPEQWQQLTQLKKKNFPDISNKWHVYVSFNEKDMEAIA